MIGLYDWIDDNDNWHFVCSQGHKYVFEMEDAEKEKQKNNAHHWQESLCSCVHLVNFKWRIPEVLNSKVEKVTAEATNFANQQLYCYEVMIAIYA